MRISCSSLFLWDYSIKEIIEILTIAGIDSIEFWAETPEFWMHRYESDALYHLKATISTLSDQYTVHAPILDLNASSYNEHVCRATITETLWAIDLSSKLEASLLTIHPGHRTVQRSPTPLDRDRFFKYLSVCTEYAYEKGVTLALENLPQKIQNMCYDPAQMRDVLSRFPDLMMTLDIAHALLSGIDNVLEFISLLGDRIVNVHFGDIYNGFPHYPGYLNRNPQIIEIIRKLKGSGYNNNLTIEIDDKRIDGCRLKSDKISVLINEERYLKQILEQNNNVI